MHEEVTQVRLNEWLERLKALQCALDGYLPISNSASLLSRMKPIGAPPDLSDAFKGISQTLLFIVSEQVQEIKEQFCDYREGVIVNQEKNEIAVCSWRGGRPTELLSVHICDLRKNVLEFCCPQINTCQDSPLYMRICFQMRVNNKDSFLVPVDEIESIGLTN